MIAEAARRVPAEASRLAPGPLLLPLEPESPAEPPPAAAPLRLSPAVDATSWQALADARRESRSRGVEGLMFKRLSLGLRRRTPAR